MDPVSAHHLMWCAGYRASKQHKMQNKDYYKILGIDKTASQDEVKKAFRKLAHEHHPDKKGGNDAKFKEASEAYSVLGDPEKRKQYDQFGSNMGGGGGFNPQDFGGFDFSGFQGGFNGQNVEFDLGDIFSTFFGGGRMRKGKSIRVDIDLTFKESIFGTEREVRAGGNSKITIKIPPGVDNGTTLRVAGRGEPLEGGQPGDLHVQIYVTQDPRFKKQGMNIVTDARIPLSLSLLGGEQLIPTLDGDMTLKIPERISNGEILRVKGKGVPDERGRRGDLYVRIVVDLSKKLSRESRKLIEDLKKEGF
jgi:curved DNA-binding protein